MEIKALLRLLATFIFVCLATLAGASTTPEALEKFPLETLRVVQTNPRSAAFRQPVAIILGPDRYIYYAIKGMYIGKNKGVLVRIEATAISISEVGADGMEVIKRLPVQRS